jgi:hypothetical protein
LWIEGAGYASAIFLLVIVFPVKKVSGKRTSPALTLAELIRVTGYPAGAISSTLGFLTAWKLVIREDRGLVTRYRLNRKVGQCLYSFAGLY